MTATVTTTAVTMVATAPMAGVALMADGVAGLMVGAAAPGVDTAPYGYGGGYGGGYPSTIVVNPSSEGSKSTPKMPE